MNTKQIQAPNAENKSLLKKLANKHKNNIDKNIHMDIAIIISSNLINRTNKKGAKK